MLPYNYEESICEVKEIETKLKEIAKKILQQAHKMKVIERFSKQEEIDYELLKDIFHTRSINIEEIFIKLAKEKNKYFIQVYDGHSFEEKRDFTKEFSKKDLAIRFNKKVKAFY